LCAVEKPQIALTAVALRIESQLRHGLLRAASARCSGWSSGPKIIDLADTVAADLLVIGARGHSAPSERMVGSRADRLMQLAQCPVLVMK